MRFILSEQKDIKSYTNEELEAIIKSTVYAQELKTLAIQELQNRKDKSFGTFNPITTSNKYWWSDVNLNGYEKTYPPVKWYGKVYKDKDNNTSCSEYGTYNGIFGCYYNQLEEHKQFMKKWFNDNKPGDEFYKDNVFYVKGRDGLPVFNYDESRKKTPSGFHPEEYPIYLAECNNIETKYQTSINNLLKNKKSDIDRLKVKKKELNDQFISDKNKTLTDQKYLNNKSDYDPQGGIGQALSASQLPNTGKRALDSILILQDEFSKMSRNIDKQIADRQTQYVNDEGRLIDLKNKELDSKKNEYYHPEYPNGITKIDFAKLKKMGIREREKAEFLLGKKFELKTSDPTGYGQLDIAEQNPMGMGMIPWEPDPSYFKSQEEWLELKKQVEEMEKGYWEKYNQQVPSTLKDVQSVDYEMSITRNMVADNLRKQGVVDNYKTELDAIKAAYGYIPPEKPEPAKPWHGEFWKDPGDNFVDWLTSWDVHDIMMLASIVSLFIPGLQGVGLAMRGFRMTEVTAMGLGITDAALLSAAVDLADAGIWLSEGNSRMAGLSVLFAFLPFAVESTSVKAVFKDALGDAKMALKFLLACPDFLTKSVTTMTMKELFEYTKLSLKPEIQAALKAIAENASKLTTMIKNSSARIFSKAEQMFGQTKVADYIVTSLNYSAKGFKKIGVPLVKAGVTLAGYMEIGSMYNTGVDDYNEVIETPKTVVEKIIGKNSWELVKNEFGSDGSSGDNLLLKNAVVSGWRPGMLVPIEFQTETYKKRIQTNKKTNVSDVSPEDLKKLEEIIKTSNAVKENIKEKAQQKTKEVIDFSSEVELVTDEEWKRIVESALEEEQSELQNESMWFKFLKNKNIIS
jgi:hypothetical protein